MIKLQINRSLFVFVCLTLLAFESYWVFKSPVGQGSVYMTSAWLFISIVSSIWAVKSAVNCGKTWLYNFWIPLSFRVGNWVFLSHWLISENLALESSLWFYILYVAIAGFIGCALTTVFWLWAKYIETVFIDTMLCKQVEKV